MSTITTYSKRAPFYNAFVMTVDEQSTYYYNEGFNSEPGVYDLDAEILSDASCHNPGHPRLIIYTDDSGCQDYKILFSWLVPLIMAVGIALLLVPYAGRTNRKSPPSVELKLSDNRSQNFRWAQMLPLEKPVSGLPLFGTVAAIVMLTVFAPVCLVTCTQSRTVGLRAYVLKPGAKPGASDPWTEPLIVRIPVPAPKSTILYLNSQSVLFEQLRSVLKAELSRRPPACPVYIQADDDAPWELAARVVDIIQNLHGRPVILPPEPPKTPSKTPRKRAVLGRRSASAQR